MKSKEVYRILRDIPVEELNRNKQGFRVKTLRDNGYSTIANIVATSYYSLSSIYGISSEAAYSIKKAAADIAQKVSEGVKIRLSVDDQNSEATELVKSLSSFCQLERLLQRSEELLSEYRKPIGDAIEALRPGTGGFRWFFSSSVKKDAALKAFQYLSELKANKYMQSASTVFEGVRNSSNRSDAQSWIDFSDNPVQFFNILEDIAPGVLGTDDAIYGLPEDLAREIQDEQFFPNGLLCQLRRYQEWGVKYILHQEKVLLGDEMGLGKTVQAIAAMVSLKNTGATHFVVVCPASVLTNWYREVRKMSRLQAIIIHGSSRSQALKTWINAGGVAITTYETTKYFNLPQNFRFTQLVVDEAHYIKNPEAARTIHLKALSKYADRILFMTGTALENRVEEMVSLIRVLRPDIALKIHGMESISSAPLFRTLIAPVYYRRKREDVLTELPELIENQEWCTLFPAEEQVYEQTILSKNYATIRRVSWNIDDLRYSSKAIRLKELIDEAGTDGRKIIVFSFFLDTINKIYHMLGSKCSLPITGAIPPGKRQQIIDEFDNAPAGHVLLAQIQSGGTGLNIQSASVVIICEPQFKPSIENQAISRAYRMGQTRNVLVYRLLCENTVDERITDLLENKQLLFDAFADKSVAADNNKELDEKTFGNIIEEEIERIKAKQHGRQAPKNTINETVIDNSNKPIDDKNSSSIKPPIVPLHSAELFERSSNSKDPVLGLIKKSGFEYVDKRSVGGSLWIIAGKTEGFSLVSECRKYGKQFAFTANGSKSSGRRPAWYSIERH